MHNTKQYKRAMRRLETQRALAAPGASEFDILCLAGAECDASDVGNADRLMFKYGSRMAYTDECGWFVYSSDGRWKMGEVNALGLAGEVARNIKYETKHLSDPRDVKNRHQWAARSGNSNHLRGMLKAAEPTLSLDISAFDKVPYLWNCPNGTVDLRTGVLQPHSEHDLMTKMSGIRYNPAATCPTWERFLSDVFSGDQEMISFVHRMVGYCMFGHQMEQKAFFLVGDPTNAKENGSNGKSLFQNVLGDLFGEYSTGVDSDLIVLTRNKSTINNAVAALRGARLGIGTEFDRGDVINDRELKRMTSSDVIKARFLHKEFFDFETNAKLMFSSNYMPTINGNDDGIWRRVVIIPFKTKFWEARECPPGGIVKDPFMREKLSEELEGILAWAVRGAMAYHIGSQVDKDGLKVPEYLYAAREERMDVDDPFGDFIDTCLVMGKDKMISAGSVWEAYKNFCSLNAIGQKTEKALAMRLSEIGVLKDKKLTAKHNRCWRRGAELSAAGKAYSLNRFEAERATTQGGPFSVVK